MLLFLVLSAVVYLGKSESICPFDPSVELSRLRDDPPKPFGRVKRYARFPREVFYTGPYDTNMKNLTIGQGVWPDEFRFHFYNDARMAASMLQLSKELQKEGIFGTFDSYRALRAMAFRADLWRYAILWACGGVYIDSKMQLAMNFNEFLERAMVEPPLTGPERLELSQKPLIMSCIDRWGTNLDPYQNLTAFWQGFLISTPKNPDMLRVIHHVNENIKNRIYPDYEGKLKSLYITGPCAMGRAIEVGHPDWHQYVKAPCHFGTHGPKMRTVWGSGNDFFTMSSDLHQKLRGGFAHSYPSLYQAKQVYYDDPPCQENCHLLKIKPGQFPEDAVDDTFFKSHMVQTPR